MRDDPKSDNWVNVQLVIWFEWYNLSAELTLGVGQILNRWGSLFDSKTDPSVSV
jgi:hypothetical protein